jgi:sigma-E factor negative regulatory protein RseB
MPAIAALRRRPGLMVSAAVTITVPGLLAAVALVGHEHAASAASVASVAAAGAESLGSGPPATLSTAPFPAGAQAGPAAVSHEASIAVRQAAAEAGRVAGVRAQFFDYTASAQSGLGMRLLTKSATAGLAASYQGVELIAQWGVSGAETTVSDVWHRGGLTVTQTSDAGTLSNGQPYVSYDDNGSPEGVFGVTSALVALLGKHYIAVYQGTGSAVGRPALIVGLDRADGSLAARFWLDKQTMVPLRREVYDTSAQLISEDAFVQVQFGAQTPPPAVAATSPSPAGSAWAAAPAPARLVADLNKQGWQLPAALPGGLPLYAAALSPAGAGQVVDLGYSDGLSVVSLFVQRGTLAPKPAGWQQASLVGHQVYVAGHSIIWAGDGFVYTMMADAPPAVVTQVVASLPQETAPGGVFGRITRGLQRLATLVNPFG